MFLDESGDHNLHNIDPQYPVFVLGGVIVARDYVQTDLEPALADFKLALFGNTDLILRTAEISRNRKGFERLKEAGFRQEFYGRLNDLMRRLDYKVAACAIRKDKYLEHYGLTAVDPYMLSLHVLVELFCFEVGDVAGGGLIVAEKRGHTLDREIDVAWLDLKSKGSRHLPASTIDGRIAGLSTVAKKENIAGLQLADLVISPLARWVLGKENHEDFTIVKEKLLNRAMNPECSYSASGLVVLPKN
jgi:hypothetical protein